MRLKRFITSCEKIGRRIIYALAGVCLHPQTPSNPFDIHRMKKILLVKEPLRMGDALQVTPSIVALRKECPGAVLSLVVRKRNRDVFRNNRDLNDVIVFDKELYNRRPWKAVSFIRDLRKRRFDLAVTLETFKVHLTNDWIAFMSGAPYRARYDGASFGAPWSNAFYNILVPFNPEGIHEVEKNFGVLKALGVPESDKRLVFSVTDEDERHAHSALSSAGIGWDQKIIGVHPGSKKIEGFRWPITRYQELVRKLKEAGQGSILVVLGPHEEDMADKFPGVPVIKGLSLGAFGALARKLAVFVCNDTGVMHIAGAVGTRTIAIFGNTNPATWLPPGEHMTAIQGKDRTPESVHVHEVLHAVRDALEQPKR